MKQSKRNLFWLALFPILAALAICLVVSTAQDFSFQIFWQYLLRVRPGWLAGAVACMLAFVFLEGLSLWYICRRLRCRAGIGQGVVWSAADIFFSAITPSATGGQPASALFMVRAGIPGPVCTVALLLNLILYTLSLLILGPVLLLLAPEAAAWFGPLSRALVGAGFVIQLVLAALFLLLMTRERLIRRLAAWLLSLLRKLRLVRQAEKWQAGLEEKLADYRACARAVGRDARLLLGAFVCNLLQRLALILVPVCIFLGTGGGLRQAPAVAAVQSCIVLGSNAAPLPGAIGVADYLFLDGYAHLVGDTVSMELLSRGISFYGCFLVSGLIVLGGVLGAGIHRRREKI